MLPAVTGPDTNMALAVWRPLEIGPDTTRLDVTIRFAAMTELVSRVPLE